MTHLTSGDSTSAAIAKLTESVLYAIREAGPTGLSETALLDGQSGRSIFTRPVYDGIIGALIYCRHIRRVSNVFYAQETSSPVCICEKEDWDTDNGHHHPHCRARQEIRS